MSQLTYTERLLFLLLFVQGAYSVLVGNWSNLFVIVAAVLIACIPYVLAQYVEFAGWRWFRIAIIAFTVCSLVLGEIHRFYNKFFWWDIALHSFAGIWFGAIAYALLYSLVHQKTLEHNPVFHTIFAFSASCAVLVLWEVYEFTVDQFNLSANQMQPSLFDTMTDLIVGIIGVLFACIVGYWLLRRQKIDVIADHQAK